MKQTIYLGLNDQHTKEQVISTTAALLAVGEICNSFFSGATIQACEGIYKHLDGTKVSEQTIKIELFNASQDMLHQFIGYIKKQFNQESILLTTETNIKTEFI